MQKLNGYLFNHHFFFAKIQIELHDNTVTILCESQVTDKTGCEMEALTGATIAALTIYDMCKSLDKEMVIGECKLLQKTGGKSGDYYKQL